MVKRETAIGNASPVRKAFVAFRLGGVFNETVVLAFEGRTSPKAANTLALELNKHVSDSSVSLSQGEFKLSKGFYESGMIMAQLNGEIMAFDSIGTYADYINDGDIDAYDSVTQLTILASCIYDNFSAANMPIPSKGALVSMFVTGEGYDETRKLLTEGFMRADYEQKLTELLFNVLMDYHGRNAKRAGKIWEEKVIEGGNILGRLYNLLPFCIVDEQTVGILMNSIYPVVLASGVPVNLQSLLKYRLERGREYLAVVSGIGPEEDEPVGQLTELLASNPKALLFNAPDSFIDCMDEYSDGCLLFAEALVRNIWEAEQVAMFPEEFLDELREACMKDGLNDDGNKQVVVEAE